ncbi:MAG: MerR family transcriptional regulator [Erysipelotrichales bacterium]|nr:MerR family transcriptional regulator [Erysipelotrichales bacterium]
MKEDLIPIGKMSAMNHISIATLRLYDEKNLLKPRYIDQQTGYRYYDIQQNARLDLIAYMKELGMSLSEISEVLKRGDVEAIEDILVRKNDQIYEQIQELKERRDAVKRAIMSLERYRKSPTTGTLVLEFIDRRYIWGLPCSENFYDGDIKDYERVLFKFRNALSENNFNHIHTFNVGTSIDKNDFINGNLKAKDIFIFTKNHDKTKLQVIDSGMFACIYLDNYDDEIEYANKLRDFCIENNYQIAGDYICEVMTEFNVFDSNQRNMFMRLQIPVKFS